VVGSTSYSLEIIHFAVRGLNIELDVTGPGGGGGGGDPPPPGPFFPPLGGGGGGGAPPVNYP